MEKREFKEGVYNHIYQRTRNRFNIFYDLCDFLSYYSIFGVMAIRYKVQVLGLCMMIDHLHMLLRTKDRKTDIRYNLSRQQSCRETDMY